MFKEIIRIKKHVINDKLIKLPKILFQCNYFKFNDLFSLNDKKLYLYFHFRYV